MSDQLAPIPWFDVLLILALIAVNGVLAMSELAIVSSVSFDGPERNHADFNIRRRVFGGEPGRACGAKVPATGH
jgi:hypothetical protein